MFFGLLSCKEALKHLEGYMDRELSPQEVEQVDRHLKICHACRQLYTNEARLMEQTSRKLERVAAPDPVMPEISETMRRLREDKL